MSRKLIQKAKNVLEQELGTVYKNKGVAVISMALSYPNSYYVGQSNLGFQTMYRIANNRNDMRCERVFLPNREDEDEMRRTGTLLFSLESQQTLKEFDLLAFSVSFELDYINTIKIMELAGIPTMAAERDERFPLVIGGGPCITFNPEPLSGFFDLFIIGEGEESFEELCDLLYTHLMNDTFTTKQQFLEEVGKKIPGIYVPSLYEEQYDDGGNYLGTRPIVPGVPEKVRRRWVRSLDDYPTKSVLLTPDTEFGNMFLIEISRGCGRHCRFCMAGYCYRVPRVRTLESVLQQVDEGSRYRERIGLMGAAISDYPWIDELCTEIVQRGLSLSVASFRVDSITPTLLHALVDGGLQSLTVAPEAASERLRRVINKDISEDDILRAVRLAMEAGMEQVRYYMMIGLPTEEDQDIQEIVDLVDRVNQYAKQFRKGGFRRISLSINPFIPKPFTPFQWEPMEDKNLLEKKIKMLKKALQPYKNIEVGAESPRWTLVQALLARGDRNLGPVLEQAYQLGGNWSAWRKALQSYGLTFEQYVYRRRGREEALPWDHLDWGVDKDYLWNELQQAIHEQFTPSCLPSGCTRCGVCVKEVEKGE